MGSWWAAWAGPQDRAGAAGEEPRGHGGQNKDGGGEERRQYLCVYRGLCQEAPSYQHLLCSRHSCGWWQHRVNKTEISAFMELAV